MSESNKSEIESGAFQTLRKKIKTFASQSKRGLKSPRFDSSDVAQLAFMQVWKAWQSVGEAGVEHLITNGGFLKKVCFGQTANLIRFHRAHKRTSKREDHGRVEEIWTENSPLGRLAHREDLESLMGAVAQLREDDRNLIFMRFEQSMTFEEIAKAKGQSVNRVYRHFKKALAEISRSLSEND